MVEVRTMSWLVLCTKMLTNYLHSYPNGRGPGLVGKKGYEQRKLMCGQSHAPGRPC